MHIRIHAISAVASSWRMHSKSPGCRHLDVSDYFMLFACMYRWILRCLLLVAEIGVAYSAILSIPANTSQIPVHRTEAVHCTRDKRWTKPYQKQDCVSAVDLFRRHETAIYGESSVTFLAPKRDFPVGVHSAATPRKYIVGRSEDEVSSAGPVAD